MLNPANPKQLLVLNNERAGGKITSPSSITLWRGAVDKLEWTQDRKLVELPKSDDNPNKDLGYPWLLHNGGDQWQLYFYYGRSRGEYAIWLAEVTIN